MLNYEKATPAQMTAIGVKIEKLKKKSRQNRIVFILVLICFISLFNIWLKISPQIIEHVPDTEIVGPDHPIKSYYEDYWSQELPMDSAFLF
ncbi:MAG: hypothetical protein ACI8XB_001591 [Patiriisocius sp.]|jgi:hypothetical protein